MIQVDAAREGHLLARVPLDGDDRLTVVGCDLVEEVEQLPFGRWRWYVDQPRAGSDMYNTRYQAATPRALLDGPIPGNSTPVALPYGLLSRLHRIRSRVAPTLRRALGRSEPSWTREPNTVPWFDQPDALARIDGGPDADVLRKWVEDGYVVIDGLVDEADIDAMIATLDGLWDAPAAVPHLTLLDLRDPPEAPPRNVTHAEVLGWDRARRERTRAASAWRIHGFHYLDAAAGRVFWAPRLRAFVSRLFGRRARPFAAINFMAGSRQHLHQDMGVFHIYPHNYLVGAWIACEDIAPDSGPLVLHPGSHRAPFFPGFTDYPQTNLRTADDTLAAAYEAYVEEVAGRYPREEFLAREGQVLLWHGMLVHGGAPVLRPGASRKSMVIHYTVRGADRAKEVRGPVRW